MSNADTEVGELLPLTPAMFHILLSLAGGPAHGYAIMLEISRLTAGAVQLGPGTLYRTIQKLLDERLIEEDGADDDERRVPYRMTARGTKVARAEAARLAVLVKIAQRRGLLGTAAAHRGATA